MQTSLDAILRLICQHRPSWSHVRRPAWSVCTQHMHTSYPAASCSSHSIWSFKYDSSICHNDTSLTGMIGTCFGYHCLPLNGWLLYARSLSFFLRVTFTHVLDIHKVVWLNDWMINGDPWWCTHLNANLLIVIIWKWPTRIDMIYIPEVDDDICSRFFWQKNSKPYVRIEPATFTLQHKCSTNWAIGILNTPLLSFLFLLCTLANIELFTLILNFWTIIICSEAASPLKPYLHALYTCMAIGENDTPVLF